MDPPVHSGHAMTLGMLALALSGCVTVYQPLVGLQRPIAIDPFASNTFESTKVLLRCHESDGVEADELCRNLRQSLARQGATVTTQVVRKQARAAPVTTVSPSQYIIDITSKIVAANDNLLSGVLCGLSFTLIPAIEERTFGQDIVIRDGAGFILAQQSFQERFVRSFGLGIWALNGLIDLIIRPKDEKVTGDRYKEEFTRDFHGHLGQLLHNARVRSRVMHSFELEAAAPAQGATP